METRKIVVGVAVLPGVRMKLDNSSECSLIGLENVLGRNTDLRELVRSGNHTPIYTIEMELYHMTEKRNED